MWKHWVARTSTPYSPFLDFELARWTWNRITFHFPDLLFGVLMPNHFHLILPTCEQNHQKLYGLLGGISKRSNLINLWQAIPTPTDIPDQHHLRRQVRYIALNPCRKELCSDPLAWYWSTYREIMGATVEKRDPIPLAVSLGMSERNFKVRFHAYVSGDPSVSVTGTPLPIPSKPKLLAEESISQILAASASALRKSPTEVCKRGSLRTLFVHSAYRYGWRFPSLLAQICKVSISMSENVTFIWYPIEGS